MMTVLGSNYPEPSDPLWKGQRFFTGQSKAFDLWDNEARCPISVEELWPPESHLTEAFDHEGIVEGLTTAAQVDRSPDLT